MKRSKPNSASLRIHIENPAEDKHRTVMVGYASDIAVNLERIEHAVIELTQVIAAVHGYAWKPGTDAKEWTGR